MSADKPSSPRVAQGKPVLSAGATINYNECHIGHIGDNLHHHYHASVTARPASTVRPAPLAAAPRE